MYCKQASTVATLVVVVWLAASTTSEFGWTNSTARVLCAALLRSLTFVSFLAFSHPGYFGKVGMRHFHLKRNQYFTPTINVDQLWHLLTPAEQEKTKEEDKKNSGIAPVLDLNAKVCARWFFPLMDTLFSHVLPLPPGYLQGVGQGPTSLRTRHCEGKVFLQARGEEDQGGWWCLCFDRVIHVCCEFSLNTNPGGCRNLV